MTTVRSPDRERLRLPIHWSVLLGAALLLTAVLLVAGWIDRRRRAGQLAAFERADCAVVYPPALLGRLERLSTKKRLSRAFAESLPEQAQALYPDTPRLTIFYQRNGEVWRVSARHTPGPAGEHLLAPEWREWATPGASGLCAGLIRDRRFVVGRRLLTPSQVPVFVVTQRWMRD